MASGQVPVKKYSRLGGSVGRGVLPPSKITAFLFGLPGEGKSFLIQSCPDMFIQNMDCSSTTPRNPKAQIYPEIRNGQVFLGEGVKEVYDYDHVVAQKKILLEMSQTKDPNRPLAVGYDSLSAWIRMACHWTVKHAVAFGLSKEPVDNWRQLNGMSAWDLVYNEIVDTITDLRNAGYGVYVIGHVVNARIPLGEDLFTVVPELTITDNFWKRLYSVFELSALVCKSQKTVTRETTETIKVRDQVITRPKVETAQEDEYTLTVSKADLAGLAKSRVLKSPIVLPKEGTWEAFEKAYSEAIE